jgi:hypothetical protein
VVIAVKDRNSAIYGMARLYEATTAVDAGLRVAIVFRASEIDAAFQQLRGPV